MFEALVLAEALTAQPARTDHGDAPIIIVTGERVPRSRHETASSVSVLTRQSVETLPAPDRIEQILQSIPNVQLGSGGEGPTIRGQDSTGALRDLPAFLGGTRPRLTIQVDGRAVSYNELAFGLTSIWDVERIEVFRTPQTTTQGRNSIGGAIFVETRDPSFDWQANIRLIAGEARTRQASAVISGPLVADELAVRIAGDIRRSRTSSDITSAAIGIDPNRDDSELLRVKLLLRPSALPGVNLALTYQHVRSRMPQVEGVTEPYESRRDDNAGYGIFKVGVDSLTARLSIRASSDLEIRGTASTGNAAIRRFAPPGLGETRIRGKDLSAETVFDWQPGASGTRIVAGMHYLRARLDQAIDITAIGAGIGDFDDTQESVGLFGELTLKPAAALEVMAGVRYQHDRQDRTGVLANAFRSVSLDYHRGFGAWLPKLSVSFDAADGIRFGALVQRAFNPGGATLNPVSGATDTFEAEYLWDYELFTRARLAGGRLTVAANAFYYDMDNAQRTLLVPFGLPGGPSGFAAQIANAPGAWTKGMELEADWRPSARFGLRAAIGVLRTRITRTLAPVDPILGKEFQRSPHFSAMAAIDWRPVEAVTLSAQFRHNSRYFSDDAETSEQRISGSTTFDARAEYRFGPFTMFAYARNLLDEFHLTYRFQPPRRLATAGDPREVGLGLEARF